MTTSTQQLYYYCQGLQDKVPVIGDKALVDLVNGIQVSGDLVRYRKSRGFFGQILDTLTGGDRQRQILLDGNLIAGQQALCDWVLELADSLRISHIALEATQTSLLEARAAIRLQKQELAHLNYTLQQLAQQVDTRLNYLETRVRKLEISFTANQDFDRIITAWTAQQTYANFSWGIQVALLIREVFSSTVSLYEVETGDTTHYRQLLVSKILAESKHMPAQFFGLGQLLDQTCQATPDDHRQLAAGLLEIRSVPPKRLQNMPYLFALGTTLELAMLPEKVRPPQPGPCAVELCRLQVGAIAHTTDTKEFVTNLVQETANDCLSLMARHTAP